MLPVINLFGINIPTYGLLICIGIIVGLIVIIKSFSKYYSVSKEDILYALIFGIIGAIIGAKLLYIITNIELLIENKENMLEILSSMINGGFVFYGGLIGGVLGVYIYAKLFKIPFKQLLILIVPAVPLMHTFGRIGCLGAGCCYGIEYDGIGAITFMHSPVAPNGIELFPVQIVESICNLIIFGVLFFTYKKYVGTNKSIVLYMILYSITRFILEYFRGDALRGKVLWFYTSQWISIAIIILSITYLFITNRKQKENNN